MYVLGFSEAFVASLGADLPVNWVATGINLTVFVCVFVGAGWTIRVQYFILAALGVALISFFVGAINNLDASHFRENLSPHYSEGESFFTMIALFFPAVTGIMAGANMSGDPKDPSRSIPRGTIAAIFVTASVYLGQAVLLGSSRSSLELTSDSMVVKSIASLPVLIVIGIFSATLSSALSSMMGAPRVLQAFARDDVFHWLRRWGQGSGANNEPRRAIVPGAACGGLGFERERNRRLLCIRHSAGCSA